MKIQLATKSDGAVVHVTNKKPAADCGRLTHAVELMKGNINLQHSEMQMFRRNKHILGESLTSPKRRFRVYGTKLKKINVLRLGKKTRHLAVLMERYLESVQ
jgi:hypothetical protein